MRQRRSALVRAVQLAGWRLAGSGAWHAAKAAALVLSVFFTASVVYLGLKGHGGQVAGALQRSSLWIGWAAGVMVAWWCATDRASADREEGVAALARLHGLRVEQFPAARGIAATVRLTVLVALALLPVAVATVATAPGVGAAAWRLSALLPLALFSGGVGLVGGGLAAACGAAAPRHGRALLASVVLVPWALEGLVVPGSARVGSLPGLLGFLAELAAQLGAG
jgi:hypothetical protein